MKNMRIMMLLLASFMLLAGCAENAGLVKGEKTVATIQVAESGISISKPEKLFNVLLVLKTIAEEKIGRFGLRLEKIGNFNGRLCLWFKIESSDGKKTLGTYELLDFDLSLVAMVDATGKRTKLYEPPLKGFMSWPLYEGKQWKRSSGAVLVLESILIGIPESVLEESKK